MKKKRSVQRLLAGVVGAAAWFLVSCGSTGPASFSDAEVQMAASDESGLSLEITVPSPTLESVVFQENAYTRVRVAGWPATITPGFPELPVKGMLIQVPASGNIAVAATVDSPVSVPGIYVSPVPRQSVTEEGTVVQTYSTDGSAYGVSGFYPQQLASVSRVGMVRGVPVARVTVCPFQWNPFTGELRYFSKIAVKVSFEETLATRSTADAADDDFSQILSGAILNYTPVSEPSVRTDTEINQMNEILAAGQKALRIEIKQDGIYRLTWADLLKKRVFAGAIDAATFRLFNRGEEVALRVVLKTSRFDRQNYLEFYAKGLDSAFTDTNVYWLIWGGQNGKRMDVLNGAPLGPAQSPSSFADTIRFEENNGIWGLTPGAPDSDYWFWERITAPVTKIHSFNLGSVSPDAGVGTVRVCFQGRTTLNHHTRVRLNGTILGDAYWSGNVAYVQEMDFDLSLLRTGDNTLSIQAPGDTGSAVDIVYLNWFDVKYLQSFAATDNFLDFLLAGNGRTLVTVNGFSHSAIQAYDVTDPLAVAVYENCVIESGQTGYRISLEDDPAGGKALLTVAENQVKSPAAWEVWRLAGLADTSNRVDYLLIAPRDFVRYLNPLVFLRRSQGFTVLAVAVEDIYNEFNDGIADPQAIKDFLAYAYANWQKPAPTYVVLVGDATYDYRGYLAGEKKSYVPVHLSYTENLGVTPDDNWYVALEGGDVLPEMIIGRIPAASKSAAAAMARKILRYERSFGYQPAGALFAADNNEAYFETVSEDFIRNLPAGITPHRVYLSSYASVEAATGDLIDAMDAGMMMTTYTGHGDMTHWSGEGLFLPEYISQMNNGRKLTFIMTLDCLNGWFADPENYSIAESFVAASDRGAIAVFSPTGLGYTVEHVVLGNAVFSSLFDQGNRRAGVIATGAKIEAFSNGVSEDIVRTFTLFGDPAVSLKGVP